MALETRAGLWCRFCRHFCSRYSSNISVVAGESNVMLTATIDLNFHFMSWLVINYFLSFSR